MAKKDSLEWDIPLFFERGLWGKHLDKLKKFLSSLSSIICKRNIFSKNIFPKNISPASRFPLRVGKTTPRDLCQSIFETPKLIMDYPPYNKKGLFKNILAL
jgi:hypothetical protein